MNKQLRVLIEIGVAAVIATWVIEMFLGCAITKTLHDHDINPGTRVHQHLVPCPEIDHVECRKIIEEYNANNND